MDHESTKHGAPPGPPIVWCRWPATLERAARAYSRRSRPSRTWRALASTLVVQCSARLEREPARMFGLGAAIAFAFGVIVGLL